MGLKVDTSKSITKVNTDTKPVTSTGTDSPVSIFSFDSLKEHKTELFAVAGAVTTVGLIGISLLRRKNLSKTLSETIPKTWSTSTEPLTEKEIKIAKKEINNFIESLSLHTTGKKVKVKYIDSSGYCGGSANPIGNMIMIDKTIFTENYVKCIDKKGKTSFWEFCGEGTNTSYPMICKIEELAGSNVPQEFIRPLTKMERLNYAKSLAAHEAFHLQQFRNMLLHPDIGQEKVIELIKVQNPTLTQIQKIVNNKNINIFKRMLLKICPNLVVNGAKHINVALSKYYWRNLLKEQKLIPNSEVAKQTMQEYNAHKSFLFNTPTELSDYIQAYRTDLLEVGAYQYQSKIIKDLGLL